MIRNCQDLLEDYLFHHVLSPKSEENYRYCIDRLSYARLSEVDTLDYKQLLKWRRAELKRGLSASSWNTYVRHLKALFSHGIERGLLPYKVNPFAGLSVKAPEKIKKRLSLDQVSSIRQLMEKLNHEEAWDGAHFVGLYPVWFWRVVYETFYHTGIRRKQLLHIMMKDIDLKGLLLHIRIEGSKTKKERYLPIPDALAPWLEQLLDRNHEKRFLPSDQAFNVNPHNPLSRRTVMGQCQVVACFRELSRRLGFPVSTHRFRHTLGSSLANDQKANLFLIKEILGHSSIRTTMEYIEADLGAMRAVLNGRFIG